MDDRPIPDLVSDKLRKLPDSPGVYQYFDAAGTIIYIGKAKVLKNRVRSYFQSGDKTPKTRKLVETIADLKWIETSSEVEALVLETNLIKEHQPKFNVLMRDDKNFVYAKITREKYPKIEVTRRVLKDGAQYFGPKTDAFSLRAAIKILGKLFFARVCQAHPEPDPAVAAVNRKSIELPCPYFKIGLHPGPHLDEITDQNYAAWIRDAAAFLAGETKQIIEDLQAAMRAAAAAKNYEYAASLRDQLVALESLAQQQRVSDPSLASRDVIGFVRDERKSYLAILEIRDGKLIDQKNLTFASEGAADSELLAEFLQQYYDAVPQLPREIVLPAEPEESETIASWLADKAGRKVELLVPQRGAKEGLLRLAEKNAAAFRVQSKAAFENAESRTIGASAELATALKIERKLNRIECYDISHLGGEATVGSMVVFERGEPKKADYRQFKIRSLQSGEIDDFASMAEVLRRRMSYLVPQIPAGIKIRRATKKESLQLRAEFEQRGGWLDGWDESSIIFVAIREKEILACAREVVLGERQLHAIGNVWVAESARGSRLGQAVVRRLIEKSSARKVYLDCRPELEKYYSEMGFQVIDRELVPELLDPGELPGQLAMVLVKSKTKENTSFDSAPDLVILDGGKGQLSSVLKAVKFPKTTAVVGLAKKFETLIQLQNPADPAKNWSYSELNLPANSDALHLVQRIRDEAHRFANGLRKTVLAKTATASSLDEILGLGETTRRELFRKYGSIESIRAADEAELAGLIGSKKARLVREFLG